MKREPNKFNIEEVTKIIDSICNSQNTQEQKKDALCEVIICLAADYWRPIKYINKHRFSIDKVIYDL